MNRTQLSLNEGWRFHLGEEKEAFYRGFDDSTWEQVTLPHDWSVRLPFDKTCSSGTAYVQGGIGWYRGRFTLPQAYAGKRVLVVFDGIYKHSRLWINTYHLGKRAYGYSEICYDITDFVHFGDEENVLAVRVDHCDVADSRWFTGSGITRTARLVIEEKAALTWNGTQFLTSPAEGDNYAITVETEIDNREEAFFAGEVTACLKDHAGNTVCTLSDQIAAAPLEKRALRLAGSLKSPELWSAEHPYLYTLEISVRSLTGDEAVLAESMRVGIREIILDPRAGLFVNGESVKLKGVCVHHDGGSLGAAMYPSVWERRLLKLKEAGCNAIRTSHNPADPVLYDLCDELGFYVLDECFDEWENPKNKWSKGHNVYPPVHDGYAEDFPEWHEHDLRTMVLRDRNHPSVIMWSIGNEIDYPNDPYCHPSFKAMTGNNDASKPAAERQYDPNKPDARRLAAIAAELADIVRSVDDSRPVTVAAAFPELSGNIGFFDALDAVGFNYKEHLYDEFRNKYPDKAFFGSENGHGYGQWKAVKDDPANCAQFLWTGIDYLGESGGTYPRHGSEAGILNTAGLEKPGFARRRVFWSEKPDACLLSVRMVGPEKRWPSFGDVWTGAPEEELWCYTNLSTAELFVDGISKGIQTVKNEDGAFVWKEMPAGVVRVVCRGMDMEEVETQLVPEGSARLTGEIWQSPSERKEIVQVCLTLRDENGRICRTQDTEVTVKVNHGTLLALDGGNLCDDTDCTSPARKTFRGGLVAYIRPDQDCTISAESCVGSITLAVEV